MTWYEDKKEVVRTHYLKVEDRIIVLVSGGIQPTGGYGISVDDIYLLTPTIISIDSTLITPSPDRMQIQMLTNPHQIIEIFTEELEVVIGDTVVIQSK